MIRRCCIAVVVVSLVFAACGNGDDGDPTPSPTDATATASPGATDGANGGAGDDDSEEEENNDDEGSNGDESDDDPGTDDDGSNGGGAAGDLTNEQICERVTEDAVAEALGVPSITSVPSSIDTPQCAYGYEAAEDEFVNATISVLRREEDLDGRRGQAAYNYVLQVNRQAVEGNVDETDADVGDRAVVLTGADIHLGVVQLGDRIVTTIVGVDTTDVAGAVALTETTDALR